MSQCRFKLCGCEREGGLTRDLEQVVEGAERPSVDDGAHPTLRRQAGLQQLGGLVTGGAG